MPTTVTNFRSNIYKELRAYLISLFDCEVVKGRNNNDPLPYDCIVMTVLFDTDLNMATTLYDDGNVTIEQDIQATVQLDFFGDNADIRSRMLATLWRTTHATEALKSCQPLFANDPVSLEYVNEQNKFEQRFMVEIKLQYNPYYTYTVDNKVTAVDVTVNNVRNGS